MYFRVSTLLSEYIVGHIRPILLSRSKSNWCVDPRQHKYKRNLQLEDQPVDQFISMPKVKDTQNVMMPRSKAQTQRFQSSPGTIILQVLGSGARGAPTSLYVFTDRQRYLFNCGEGTQRLATEHKMKMAKLDHIFVTYSSWKHIGGLPGVALSLDDVGVKVLTLHGPPGLDELFCATNYFVKLRQVSISMAECDEGSSFEDSTLSITYVPVVSKELSQLTGDTELCKSVSETDHSSSTSTTNQSSSHSATICSTLSSKTSNGDSAVSPSVSKTESENDVYYYEHEDIRKRKKQDPKSRELKRRKLNSKSLPPRAMNSAMSYICKLKERPGVLCLQRCVDRNVPPGPLLGQLKNGKDVTLPDGSVVLSRDVRGPNEPGATFLVVECPTDDHVPSLVANPAFVGYQGAGQEDELPFLVVHFSPPEVMSHPSYFAWMQKFSKDTLHLVMNESNRCMGSIAVHRAQYLLKSLTRGTGIFPSLKDDSIKIVANSNVKSTSNSEDSPDRMQSASPKSPVPPPDVDDGSEARARQSKFYRRLEDGLLSHRDVLILPRDQDGIASNQPNGEAESQTQLNQAYFHVIGAQTLLKYHLRPYKRFDWHNTLELHPDSYIDQAKEQTIGDLFKKKFQAHFAQKKLATGERRAHPMVTFLGTGSCTPNKTRNTSGILIRTSDESYVIVDCGEATYGQIVRLKGWHESNLILQNLKAIYVSHMHADHHIGLIGLIQARRQALDSLSLPPDSKQKLLLLAPAQIMYYLQFYHEKFEPILQEFDLISNCNLLMDRHTLDPELELQLLSRTGLLDISTCKVIHCAYSYGVSFRHPEWKITYSGDTMPCEALERLGKNSTLLIHEATMEPELLDEAEHKMHSTTTQAIESGRKMNAKHVILTHFSQRYAKVPRIDGFDSCDNVGIAFDNMEVGLDDLADLPMLIPGLKEVFSEHHNELEEKSIRRELKKNLL